MSQSAQIYKLKSDVQNLLMDKLNAVDCCELLVLIDRFDELNKIWMLSLIISLFNDNYDHYGWCVLKSEPDEYISISQEILEILEGNICTYETTYPDSDKQKAWKIYSLHE